MTILTLVSLQQKGVGKAIAEKIDEILVTVCGRRTLEDADCTDIVFLLQHILLQHRTFKSSPRPLFAYEKIATVEQGHLSKLDKIRDDSDAQAIDLLSRVHGIGYA